MTSRIRNEIGNRFGRLTIISHEIIVSKSGRRSGISVCKCDCGTIKKIRSHSVFQGQTKSCGCLNKEISKINCSQLTHGQSHTRIYTIWMHMLARGRGKECKTRYFDRGIRVEKEWLIFDNFKDWSLSNGYTDKLSIDRINNDGSYGPDNCRWATMAEQSRNRSDTHILQFNGMSMCVTDWAEYLGIWPQTIYYRLKKKMPIEKILSTNTRLMT